MDLDPSILIARMRHQLDQGGACRQLNDGLNAFHMPFSCYIRLHYAEMGHYSPSSSYPFRKQMDSIYVTAKITSIY